LAVTCREGHTALWCKVEPHMPTFPIVNCFSCHIIAEIMSDHVVAFEVGNLYRERGVDSSAGASDTPVWSPPSGLTDTARNAFIKAVNRVPSV
jgi:hypothetical protein